MSINKVLLEHSPSCSFAYHLHSPITKAELSSFYRNCSHRFALWLGAVRITGMWLHLILPLGLQSENIYSLVLSRSSLISDEKCEGERSGGEGRGEAHYDSFWGQKGLVRGFWDLWESWSGWVSHESLSPISLRVVWKPPRPHDHFPG